MIICDQCRLVNGDQHKIATRDNSTDDWVIYDLCSDCLEKLFNAITKRGYIPDINTDAPEIYDLERGIIYRFSIGDFDEIAKQLDRPMSKDDIQKIVNYTNPNKGDGQ